MKLIKLSALLVLALAVSLGTTGCKKKNRGITPIPNARVSRPQDQGPIFDNTRPVNPNDTGINTTSANPLPTSWTPESVNQNPSRFAPFTVYFAFDSANIRSGEQSKISAVAADLQANPGMVLIIDGHCDERGTEGYNQTLSERRALTLREEVVKLGVNPERILTRGFSEMRPAVDGHDESAWSKNRRGEFIAGTPK